MRLGRRATSRRLSPELMLLASAHPDRAIESSDAQDVLSSLAMSKQDKISVPTFAPGVPVIDMPTGAGHRASSNQLQEGDYCLLLP